MFPPSTVLTIQGPSNLQMTAIVVLCTLRWDAAIHKGNVMGKCTLCSLMRLMGKCTQLWGCACWRSSYLVKIACNTGYIIHTLVRCNTCHQVPQLCIQFRGVRCYARCVNASWSK